MPNKLVNQSKICIIKASMKVSRIVLSGKMRMADVIPADQIMSAFEDPTTDEVQFILAGNGMYDPDCSVALVELVEDQHRKYGKKVISHLLTNIGILDFFIWLRCGISSRNMRPSARVWLKIPAWSRFSAKYDEESDVLEEMAEQRIDTTYILDTINEYIPLAECDGKHLTIHNLDEFGLLEESYLALMEKQNYGTSF